MIPEPQRTYVLDLIAALGPAANQFILAGAQAMKFAVTGARGTNDVEFLLPNGMKTLDSCTVRAQRRACFWRGWSEKSASFRAACAFRVLCDCAAAKVN